MERKRRFIFSGSDPNFLSSGTTGQEPSSSSGMSETVEEMEDPSGSGASSTTHKQLVDTVGFGSSSVSNSSSIEWSEELVCLHGEQLLNNSKDLGIGYQELHGQQQGNPFQGGSGSLIGNVTDSLEMGHRAWCNRSYDGVLCWPETAEGTSATLLCFAQFNGIHYDTSRNVTRFCEEGGLWEKITDYTSCVPLSSLHPQETEESMLRVTILVYFFGYCLSLVSLIAAIIIFLTFKRRMPWSTSKARKLFQVSEGEAAAEQTNPLEEKLMMSDRHSVGSLGKLQEAKKSFQLTSQKDLDEIVPVVTLATILMGKMMRSSIPNLTTLEIVSQEELELRCLRNKIHIQLISSYILDAIFWIITHFITTSTTMSMKGSSQVSCVIFFILYYFHLTNFLWMFVEGLYLYVLVVQTFTAENIRLRVYSLIGWGLPLLDIVGWSIAKWLTKSDSPESIIPAYAEQNVLCAWIVVNLYDWIYKAAALLALSANFFFLFRIMWVLITKLRSATNPETQQSRKAAKALLVLIPLLGITYLLIFTGSKLPVYEYIRALLISTQGFLVALLFCFLNGEVRTALRHRWSRIRSSGCPFNLGRCCGCVNGRRRHLQHVRDWSPNCRTESIRFYTPAIDNSGKRESTVSEISTMTNIHGGGGSLNGNSGIQPLSASAVKRLSTLSSQVNNTPRIYTIPDESLSDININV